MDLTGSTTLEISGLALYDAIGILPAAAPRTAIQSGTFAAGGYDWCVWFYSTGYYRQDRFAMCLQLLTWGAKVRASCEFSVIDPTAAEPPWSLYTLPLQRYECDYNGGSNRLAGDGVDIDKSLLYDWAPGYVRGGVLTFQCTVTVVPEDTETPVAASASQIYVPPSEMMDQFGEVLETKEGADVTFSVDGELFHAHKIILAARSPVFRVSLYAGIKENGTQPIVIHDMRPDTFRALLRYIYTDSSPASADEDGDGSSTTEKVRELLEAADRYGVLRLKLICEHILCKRLDVENVADTLDLADQQTLQHAQRCLRQVHDHLA